MSDDATISGTATQPTRASEPRDLRSLFGPAPSGGGEPVVKVRFNDVTLRDGEQAPGVAFSAEEKVAIATALDTVGVDAIEAGVPAMGGTELEAVTRIAALGLSAQISAWCRAAPSEVAAAAETGVDAVHICLPASDLHLGVKLGRDRRWARARILACVTEALHRGVTVTVGFEDASRADDAFVTDLALDLAATGATRFRWADTVGVLDPFTATDRLAALVTGAPVPWEIHTHDDFGLATATTLAAVLAGFGWVSTTVAGLGERAGNAPLEEVALALRHLHGLENHLDTTGLTDLAELVARASGRPVPPGKAVVGAAAFAHESGIHVDGVLKAPVSYEPYCPDTVGARRRLVMGKHSGRRAVREALTAHGIDPIDRLLPAVVHLVRERAVRDKRLLATEEIADIYAGLAGSSLAVRRRSSSTEPSTPGTSRVVAPGRNPTTSTEERSRSCDRSPSTARVA
jgi:homocitrate synthase NifV